jgi:hypothetical protein
MMVVADPRCRSTSQIDVTEACGTRAVVELQVGAQAQHAVVQQRYLMNRLFSPAEDAMTGAGNSGLPATEQEVVRLPSVTLKSRRSETGVNTKNGTLRTGSQSSIILA